MLIGQLYSLHTTDSDLLVNNSELHLELLTISYSSSWFLLFFYPFWKVYDVHFNASERWNRVYSLSDWDYLSDRLMQSFCLPSSFLSPFLLNSYCMILTSCASCVVVKQQLNVRALPYPLMNVINEKKVCWCFLKFNTFHVGRGLLWGLKCLFCYTLWSVCLTHSNMLELF